MLLIRIIFFITHVVTLKSENQFDFYVQCAEKDEFDKTCNEKNKKLFNKILRANQNYRLYNTLNLVLDNDNKSTVNKEKNHLVSSAVVKSILKDNGESIQKNTQLLNTLNFNNNQICDIENTLNKVLCNYYSQYRKIFHKELTHGSKQEFSLKENTRKLVYTSLKGIQSDLISVSLSTFFASLKIKSNNAKKESTTLEDAIKSSFEVVKSNFKADIISVLLLNCSEIATRGITDDFLSLKNHFTKNYNYKKTKKYQCSKLIESIEKELDYLEKTYQLDLNNKKKIEIPYNTTTKNNFIPFYSINLHKLFEEEHFYDINDQLLQKIELCGNLLAAIKIKQKLEIDCSYSIPKITKDSQDIIIKDIFLPSVISYNSKITEPIKNSITFKQNHYKNYFLVSPIGSGKSVLMSALGLNIKYLSKIGIVSCKDFSIPANLKLLDFTIHRKKTLGAGVSDGMNAKNIFSHQIKKVHNILNQNKKVLFITDEPLRETTPKDSTPYYLKNMEPLWENNNFNSITITHNDNLVKTVYPQLFYNALDSYKKKAAFLLQEQLEKIIDPTYQPYIPVMKKKYENIGLLYFKTHLNDQGRFSTFKLDIDKNFDSPENFWFTNQEKREQYEKGQKFLKEQKEFN
jgi:hypothetical protein